MPDPISSSTSTLGPWGAAGIGAGASIIGDVANLFGQSKANKQSQKWQEKMYGMQRADALSDWNMQNSYNSPAAQMERYKAAGLNPKLIYGQSNMSQPVRSSSPGSFTAKAPEFRGLSNAGSLFTQAYQDNLNSAKQRELTDSTISKIGKEKELIDVQKVKTAQDAKTGASVENKNRIDAFVKETLLPYQKQLMEGQTQKNAQSIENMKFQITQAMRDFDLRKKVAEQGMKKTAEEILNLAMDRVLKMGQSEINTQTLENMKQTLENLKSGNLGNQMSNYLKVLEAEMTEKGIMKGDNMIMRGLQNFFRQLFGDKAYGN